MSRPAGKVKITVYDESNAKLADEEQTSAARRDAADRHLNPSSDAAAHRAARLTRGNWAA